MTLKELPEKLWNNETFICPFEPCISFTTSSPQKALTHLESHHSIKIESPIEIIPYFIEYINHLKTQKPNTSINDSQTRTDLSSKKLTEIINTQTNQRNHLEQKTTCFFCKETSTSIDILTHLYKNHNMNIGHYFNLVNIDSYIEMLQCRINEFKCIYCNGLFPDKLTLFKHMRNKKHLRVKQNDPDFDEFYVVNYIRYESNQMEDQKDDVDSNVDSNGDWSDFNDPIECIIKCLFCPFETTSFEKCKHHLSTHHSFHLDEIIHKFKLDFYQCVKFINYLRDCYLNSNCPGCQNHVVGLNGINHSFEGMDCLKRLNLNQWDFEKYLFPILKDDYLLNEIQPFIDE